MNTATIETAAPTETGTIVPVLSSTERVVLLECESIVRHGLKAFVEVGHALARIRDSKLYRERFGTFEDYCLKTWDISDRHARHLWSAAEVVDELAAQSFAVLPETESQARPLTKLPRVEWVPAWEETLGTAPNGKVTANHVQAVVQRRRERLNPKPTAIEKPDGRSQKVEDAGTRGERILAVYESTQANLRELQDLMRGDGGAVHLSKAVSCMDSFQQHFHTVSRLKNNVEHSLGLNAHHTKRVIQHKQTEGTQI